MTTYTLKHGDATVGVYNDIDVARAALFALNDLCAREDQRKAHIQYSSPDGEREERID